MEAVNPLSDESLVEFLHALHLTSQEREWMLPRGFRVWRAQLGADERPMEQRGPFLPGHHPHPPARMKPTSEFAAEGRVNQKGDPCFAVHCPLRVPSRLRPLSSNVRRRKQPVARIQISVVASYER
jgi:hypothetical protein